MIYMIVIHIIMNYILMEQSLFFFDDGGAY